MNPVNMQWLSLNMLIAIKKKYQQVLIKNVLPGWQYTSENSPSGRLFQTDQFYSDLRINQDAIPVKLKLPWHYLIILQAQ